MVQVPPPVKEAFAKMFPTAADTKKETPDKGLIYEMDLKKDKEGFEVQFSSKGDILKKTHLKKEKEEDEKK